MQSSARKYQDWFEVTEPETGIFDIYEPFHFERVHSYLVIGTDRAVLIDTGMGVGNIKAVVDDLTTLPVVVLNSHAHWDHVGGNWRFHEILIHEAEAADLERGRANSDLRRWFDESQLSAPLPAGESVETVSIKASHATTQVKGGERLDIGGRILEIVHAPGHSPGGIVVVDRSNRIMFTTDVAYLAPLYCYSPWTDARIYRDSLKTLEEIAIGMRAAYPSHDRSPIDPAVIADMRAAFDAILAGRQPDGIDGAVASHQFGPFSVLVSKDYRPGASRS